MEADFSGYATKAGLKCSDGRTIMPDAFKHQDGLKVPLVWQHGHNEPTNVLGHAVLENRSDGVYTYAYFNTSDQAKSAKTLVEHGDIVSLSIYANKLVEKAQNVLHGAIREVSLVLSGANPGALIDNVNLQHADGAMESLEDEAVIYTGLTLEHEDMPEAEEKSEEKSDDETAREIYDSLDEKQKAVVHYMVGVAAEGESESAKHEDLENPEDTLNHQEGTTEMTHNVFEQTGKAADSEKRATLTHSQIDTILQDAQRTGSLKESVLAHAVEYGIEDIELLFPDARAVANSPEWISRQMEWVTSVINGAKHSPFSRIKSLSADITHDEARAKGYVKGTLKKDEFFKIAARSTSPTTIYKKQKLDRDDIVDITDLDVVAWLKAEMRVMLEEELARAVLVGDGREASDDDWINTDNIRPIAMDDDFYAHQVTVPANVAGNDLVKLILRSRPKYKGAGNPTMYCVEDMLTDLLLVEDRMGRRLYPTEADVAAACRVSKIVTVPVMEDVVGEGGDVRAILVNMSDYTIGADKGGQVTMFDDFDIDFNQYKYLLETRVSGALTKHKTALVFTRLLGTLVAPTVPSFVKATGVVTIPTKAGVAYFQDGVAVTSGAQTAVEAGETTVVTATAEDDYYFANNTVAEWTFVRNS